MLINKDFALERIDIPDISGIPVYVQIPVLAICIIQKYRYTELSVFHCVIPFAGLKHYFKSNLHCLYIITFINKKTKFIITEGRFSYLNVVFQRRAMAKFRKK